MSIQFEENFVKALQQADAVKLIVTTDENGAPHVEENPFIDIDENARLVLLEPNEHSRTNHNLVRSIWFGKKLTIHIRAGRDQHYEVVGKPYKAIVTGPLFEEHYQKLRSTDDAANLSTVWLIDAETVTDEQPSARREREDRNRLPLLHLDRIAKQ